MMPSVQRTVVVLGASPRPERFSHKAVLALQRHGHQVIPVYPRPVSIAGIPARTALSDIRTSVDILTLYLGPARSLGQVGSILALKPGRVILNPGTGSEVLQAALDRAGIPWVRGCTLRMLENGGF